MSTVVPAAATVAAGLMAGLFAAFSYAVLPGLRRSDDRTFVAAMRDINVGIVNGWFLALFLGTLVLGVASVVLWWGNAWVLAGTVAYVLTLVVTGAVNLPLNNALAAADPDPAAARRRFERPWVRWNLVRTATSLASFVCFVVALVR